MQEGASASKGSKKKMSIPIIVNAHTRLEEAIVNGTLNSVHAEICGPDSRNAIDDRRERSAANGACSRIAGEGYRCKRTKEAISTRETDMRVHNRSTDSLKSRPTDLSSNALIIHCSLGFPSKSNTVNERVFHEKKSVLVQAQVEA